MNLKNKIVLISGSSSGIGATTAIEFAKKGSIVIITYFSDPENGKMVQKECNRYTTTHLLQLDLTDNRAITRITNYIIKKYNRLDILVNNAGVFTGKKLLFQSRRNIDEQVNVNLLGLIKLTRSFLPYLLNQRNGIIINVSSGLGKKVIPEASVYCAAKFGVNGFSKALATELPVRIRVYTVNPIITATKMTDYQGIVPEKIAKVILDVAEEKSDIKSGDDIDVSKYLKHSKSDRGPGLDEGRFAF